MNGYLASVSVAMGSLLTFAFGTWPESLTFLLVVMAVDWLSGLTASVREGSGLDSSTGFWGLLKKGFMLLVILLAHRIDLLMDIEITMGGAIAFYIVNELLSVIENMGRMGLPLPPQLMNAVRVLRDRVDNEKKTEDKLKQQTFDEQDEDPDEPKRDPQ